VGLSLAALPICARLILLAWVPVPVPQVHDEFSYLLGADTFVHGRLANPSPAEPQFFETPHVLVRPTYASKYPPGQSLLLAASLLLTGHPYPGVVFSIGLLALAAWWMLRGWLASGWAAVGGLLVALRFSVPHYWVNSYWGGSLAAIGGCLVVGAVGRMRQPGSRAGLVSAAAGLSLLLLTRPYEGLLLGVPALGYGLAALRRRHPARRLLGRALLAGAILGGWLWFQVSLNAAVTKDPFVLPYLLHERTYATVPFLWLLAPRPVPAYSDSTLYQQHVTAESRQYEELRGHLTLAGWWRLPARPLGALVRLYGPPILLLPLFAWWYRGRPEVAVLASVALVVWAGVSLALWSHEHYLAPALPLVLVLVLVLIGAAAQDGRHRLRRWLGLVWLVALFAAIPWCAHTQRPRPLRHLRYQVAEHLRRQGGQHLVFVRRAPDLQTWIDWVYNGADLRTAPVLWARDRGAENERLRRLYPGRACWLAEVWPRGFFLWPYTDDTDPAWAGASPSPVLLPSSRPDPGCWR